MLRDTRNQRPHSSTLRRGTIIALTLAAFVVAGLRQSTSPVAAQQAAAKKPPAAEKTPAEKLAMRNLSINHVKQLGLAFHNYLAEHGHFPPPVLLGPDGKTEYSWRVALLPYLEELELSKKYDTTQPWDSKHNRTVLEQMPTVFRSPYDDDDSTNASYFVFVGEHTALGNTPGKGIELRDYPDGTSATWLTVEAKRDIPWTKPQDIPYSADAELPKLGGWHDDGFDAGLVDGSARFYADTNDETILRRLITRDDGEVFDPSELKP